MKKTILFSSVLVALAMLASCQKEEFIETPATATGVTEFTATIESTKTTIASDGKVTWTAGDEITVTDAASKSAVYVAASSGASTTFNLKTGETAVGSGPYKATYGDVTKQKYSANGANCPLSAKKTAAGSKTLQFSSPYAVLKITAQSSNAEVIKTVAVTYGNNSYYLDCSEKNVALTSEGVDFYVAIEPANAAELSVAFYNTADKMAKKTRNGSISLKAKDLLPVKFDLSSSTWTTPTPTKTFKAVYKGDDGTLTFYYDESLHIGEGVLYDNLPVKATAYTSWGYNGILGNIKSVKIDPSVAGYKGLTSTAYMFFNMTEAESISGAQYLDVSNVKDMTGMFYGYGRYSTSLTDVPVVSGWKTDNVEKMGNLFSSYGQYSTSLTDVPVVSGWKTDNVTDMSNLFSSYGQYSTSLTDVPDVSGWKTDNVERMGNLFSSYGDASKINCVLDLTGWNLANLTTGNVFNNFSPNTFKVTIPAKTGENANLPEKWYGSGTFWFSPPTGKTFTLLPADALAGRFSVSDTKKVHFSKGNLWYGKVGDAQSATFNFEENQYSISSSWNANHVSNFHWSKTASVAYAESYNESGTSASDVFFTDATGFTVSGQTNVWRTLSNDEWKYLFEHHTYNYVSVNGKHGIVIAPDGFSGTIADSYSTTDWTTAEGNGFVFLPSTGFRSGSSISEKEGDKISCIYWTSTASGLNDDGPTAYRTFFQWNKDTPLSKNFETGLREWAVGIRLVTE